jgi:YhcN/YlaJ family sporulation lipoprotein
MKPMKIWTFSSSTVLIAGLLLSGCGYKDTTSMNSRNTQPETIEQNMNNRGKDYSIRQINPGPQKPLRTMQQTADRLEKMAERIPDVKQATAVVFGNTVIIGLDINNKLDRTKADTVKYTVAKTLRGKGQGKNILVTADADLGKRIMNIRNGVMKGSPVKSFATELGDIIGRISPQAAR